MMTDIEMTSSTTGDDRTMGIPTWLNLTGRLAAGTLSLLLFFISFPAAATDRTGDAFLTGYVTSILERDLQWQRDSYVLKIKNGMAKITLFTDDPMRRQAVDRHLRSIDGLQGITVAIQPKHDEKPGIVGRALGISSDAEAFPTGDLFRPLIADPKQPQFFVSINSFSSLGERYPRASVGFGETFGLYRFFGNREGDGLQLSAEGAIFAQFNLDAPSSDLINADYTIGIPLTYRYGNNSIRTRFYHQSSHLGDEFLQSVNPPERINLSYEAIDLIYSREWRAWRVYGGGEYLIRKEPDDLKPARVHWGVEYRGSKPLVFNGRVVAGVDMKNLEEHDWANDTSVKAGLEFGHPNPGQRRLRLMAEWYEGYDPYGQFYSNKVDYYGLGVSLGF